ncbi:lipid-transfer protein [Nakamurella sp. YIM 132087]|uniref:propanoyl-CoA C-acyltransferase n=1 Tax=Nakamurella alba TaxID=2665158 RepID=A0A7K1FJ78_9ACTN|nr:lipid-transfer protein [Nakamurella alba]MTD14195.1 lipid-transfer protein [Nakamurella alba]
MGRSVLVGGVGMIPFAKPSAGLAYEDMGSQAAAAALADAGVDYAAIEQAYVGYVYGDSTSGQAALYPLGLTGVPVVNVNNNCATGSSALWLARQAVASGEAEVVLALGFEQMRPGALVAHWDDRLSPTGRSEDVVKAHPQYDQYAPMAAQMFGGAGLTHMEKFGTRPETFGMISVKARQHAANNPYAVFRQQVTLEEVMGSPHIWGPLTRLQCCPPTCGAAAAVVYSEEYARSRGLDMRVRLRAQSLVTDFAGAFDGADGRGPVGYDMTAAASRAVYEKAGIGPEDIKVVELHDCFTANELITYEGLGLTPEGTAEKFVMDGDNTYGGRVVTNPSGGLLSKGHPLGATGLAQCAELVWQLRGEAGPRQVEGADVALQHNIGIGGACVVSLYEKVS